MHFTIFDTLIVILMLAVVITACFHYLRVPSLIGYIVVGVIAGPYALGWVPDVEDIQAIAEFGIVFLLFTIGLEFSFARLMSLKRLVFGFGGLEVLIVVVTTLFIGHAIGLTTREAIVVGCIIAMSSTAIVMKQLTEELSLNTRPGLDALSVLLFQDLIVIPILLLLPALGAGDGYHLFWHLVFACIKGTIAIAIILTTGRRLLRPLFFLIAETRSLELFTLAALLLALGCAWLTQLFGLSMALGAFLAGMMFGETEFRHQIADDIRPFKDVFLGLFFISIGMLLNLPMVVVAWPWMVLTLLGILLFKATLVFGLGRWVFKRTRANAITTGLYLAQGGEFGFVILTLALGTDLLPEGYAQVVLGAMLLSMMLAPFLIRHHASIGKHLLPASQQPTPEDAAIQILEHSAQPLKDHVIICGYGRVGQHVAKLLSELGIAYIGLDLDPLRVKNASDAGDCVCYADATHPVVLEKINLDQAKALIICFYGIHSQAKILKHLSNYHIDLPIIVRSYDDTDYDKLIKLGATDVVPETFEASIMLATHLLHALNIPIQQIYDIVDTTRQNRYDIFKLVFPGVETLHMNHQKPLKAGLYSVHLYDGAQCVGKTLGDIDCSDLEVRVLALVHGGLRNNHPHASTKLRANDTVVLYGPLANLEEAERRFLQG